MSHKTQDIWRLEIGGPKYLGLIPHDLDYFQNHFDGKLLSDDWLPPPIKVSGRSKKLPDFVSWAKRAPIVSERAKVALEPMLRECAQFFPFHDIKGRRYFAINVTRVENALLDPARSDILRTRDEPIFVKKVAFVSPLPSSLPPMFKLSIGGRRAFGDITSLKSSLMW